ncbi:hypothetical protein MTO96_030718 [Rhipicephalus appendiculatus]
MAAVVGGPLLYVPPRSIQKEVFSHSVHVERLVCRSPRRLRGDPAKCPAASLPSFPIRSPEASRRVMRCALNDSRRCLPPGP